MSTLLLVIVLVGFVILIAYGLALYGIRNAFLSAGEVSTRLEAYAAVPDTSQPHTATRRRSGFIRWRMRLNSMMSVLASEKISMQLTSANWPITESEYVLIRIWGSVISFGLGWLIGRSFISGLGMAVLAFLVPELILRRSIINRQMAFERQLVDVLMLTTGAVRAGYSLPQALDLISKEMRAPASEEFRRVRQEVGLGLPLSQALTNLVTRMQNDDLYLAVTAININSQVGGNLVTMLQAVTNTIRERIRLFGEVRVMTAQQRFGSLVLTFLPIGIGAGMFVINPDYMSRLLDPQIICLPIGAVIGIVLGNIAIRRLGKIEV
ncbi:MAG TPA: type II secretion system F family protein [Anaerolineales bacterium]|nr:type II secretion system F family protein [Anaerolineales bacterium]